MIKNRISLWLAIVMKIKFKPAATLFVLFSLAGCASQDLTPSPHPVITGKPASLDSILVETSSSLTNSGTERGELAELIVSDLKETQLFENVSANRAEVGSSGGIKIHADLRAIKKVSDDARSWAGALAGQARIVASVTITDLESGNPVETFEAEGRSGQSAFAGTTEEAIQNAAAQVAAEVVKLNVRSAQY